MSKVLHFLWFLNWLEYFLFYPNYITFLITRIFVYIIKFTIYLHIFYKMYIIFYLLYYKIYYITRNLELQWNSRFVSESLFFLCQDCQPVSRQSTYFINILQIWLWCTYPPNNFVNFALNTWIFSSFSSQPKTCNCENWSKVDSPSDRHAVRHANVADGNPSRSKGSSTRSCDHDYVYD